MPMQIGTYLTPAKRNLFQRLSRPLQQSVYGICGTGCLFCIGIIVMPVFWHRRNIEYHVECISNEKQLALGMLMYAQDYDGTFPVGTRGNHFGANHRKDTPLDSKYHAGQGWAGTIYPYVKNEQVFQCPMDKTRAATGMVPISYAYNRNIALSPKQADMTFADVTVLLTEIEGNSANVRDVEERSSRNVHSATGNGLTILAAMDRNAEVAVSAGARYASGVMGGYDTEQGCALLPLAVSFTSEARHPTGNSFAMADGHAKFFKPERVSPGDDATNAKQAQDCVHGRAAGTANLGGVSHLSITFSAK